MERRHWDARTPKVGERAPDSLLLDEAGKPTTLGKAADGRPLVLLFIRSHEAAVCVRQLLEYRDATLGFTRLGAKVVAVSAAEPSLLAFFRRERGIGFALLADPGKEVIEAWGLLDAADHGGVAHPATFVLDGARVVRQRTLDAPARRTPADSIQRFVLRGGAAKSGALAGLGARLRQAGTAIQNALKPPKALVR
jgi:peroxiredoxin